MLLIDAGNSRCKWAWEVNGTWLHQGVLNNLDIAAWKALKNSFSRLQSPEKILASNVAGMLMAQQIAEVCAVWPCPVEYIAAQPQQCGVRNLYAQPAQLGSDRWAALLAAWQHVQGVCLVVNCGTATTIDALSETGAFLGGLILPGIELMQRSLKAGTTLAGMENGELTEFPLDTADAMASGAIRATAGAIQHQYQLLEKRGKVRCILSGGAAKSLLPHLGLNAELIDNLVLHGIQIIGQNCSTWTEKETVAR